MEIIPESLKTFIFATFENADQLRILQLLHASPERSWEAAAVSAKLSRSLALVEAGLDQLQQKGLVTRQNTEQACYAYQPANPEIDQLVRDVVELDRTHPVTLIRLIYARPKNNV